MPALRHQGDPLNLRARFSSYLCQHHLALVALFVAMGGVSYAAVAIPDNSVGADKLRDDGVTIADIRHGNVGTYEIRANGVQSTDIRDHSLLCEDFNASEPVCGNGVGSAGPQGPGGQVGPTGAPGETGATGPQGPPGTNIAGLSTATVRVHVETIEKSCTSSYEPNYGEGIVRCSGEETLVAACESGEIATGGSANANNSDSVTQTVASNDRPDPQAGTPTGWTVDARTSSFQFYTDQSNPPAPSADETVTIRVVCAS